MNSCRVCLASITEKDISDLSVEEGECCSSCSDYVEVMQFCLNIEVQKDSKITTKLCLDCYNKITSFHKFKHLAQKCDIYLQTVVISESDTKNEIFIRDEVKLELEGWDSTDYVETVETEHETKDEETEHETKDEGTERKEEEILMDSPEYQSDDEFLSVIKQIKQERIEDKNVVQTTKVARLNKEKRKSTKPKVEETQYQMCEECGKTFKDLKEHMYVHQPLSVRRRFKCAICEKSYSSASARYKHHKIKHLRVKQKCDICNKDVVSVKSHKLQMHNTEAMRFACVLCNQRFISQSAINTHMSIHTKDKPFQCDLCDKKFRTNFFKLQHRRQVHQKEKTHLCQFCSKSFFKKYHLQLHLRSHTKEKPYECPDCGKFFSSTSILNNHRLTHKNIKSFVCNLCDMSFIRGGYLRAHMISHTKEKKHPCKYCGVKFGRSDHRKRHEQTVHERHYGEAISCDNGRARSDKNVGDQSTTPVVDMGGEEA